MKGKCLLSMSLAILIGVAFSAPAAAGPLEDYGARGAKLFADPGLGTSGKSCASCHATGKVWAGKPRFPKFALGTVRTLDQAIQTCVVNPLQGQPLAWDDERLTALSVFIDGIYSPPMK